LSSHHITAGNQSQIQQVIFPSSVLSQLTHFPLYAIFALSLPITAGNQSQIQQVISSGLVAPLINLLQSESFDLQKESAWALSNACSGGSDEQVRNLVTQGMLEPMCEMLDCSDTKIQLVCLEALERIMSIGKGDVDNGTMQVSHVQCCFHSNACRLLLQHFH
jgi:hypothetical protein